MSDSVTMSSLQAYLLQSSPIRVPRIFIEWGGSPEQGMMLAQLMEWYHVSPLSTFAKNTDDWWEALGLSPYMVRKGIQWCIDQGFLKTRVSRHNGSPTTYYTLDRAAFDNAFSTFLDEREARKAA
jgi:hypothetical protein